MPATQQAVSQDREEQAALPSLAQVVERYLASYMAQHHDSLPHGALYDIVIGQTEQPLLRLALDYCRGNQKAAAALLGINRNTLRSKLAEHQIHADDYRTAARPISITRS